ncbi:Peptidase S41 [Tenacibaculum litopenaei]|uniref:S41 family peptidase n=1 Tax=Tenacibaculum litopenaei TaxID=396016 RepID=UPI003893E615
MNKKRIIIGLSIAAVCFSFQSRFFEIAKQIEIYNSVFKELNVNYIDEINPGDLTDKTIKSTLKNLDPYTNFFNEQDVEEAKIRREGEYGGIGIRSYYSKKGILVTEVYKGFTADKAGIKAGDLIVSVDGQSVVGLERDALSQVLKGSPGKELSLTIMQGKQRVEKDLMLDKVMVNPVPFYEMIDEETGYIVLTRFTSQKATEGVMQAFKALKEKGMKSLVFDLRSNPGGSLFDAINITNLFIPKDRVVVDTRGKVASNSRVYKSRNTPLDTEIPMVVLIDNRSASASEIVSGALQDYDRAVIMGERSFGKGLVQRYYDLSYGTQIKITISKYYTPSGRCIQEFDYENRDPKTGKVPKFSDGKVNAFTTQNGRMVYDGGGVTPDVKTRVEAREGVVNNLLRSNAVFNFATEYWRSGKPVDSLEFKVTTADFQQFKDYLMQRDTTFVTEQEKLFKRAYTAVKKNEQIKDEYSQLVTKLKTAKIAALNAHEKRLLAKIEKEIVKQVHYREGMYRHQLRNDAEIQRATALLKNKTKYRAILAK